ncbi:ABC transporter substrate-binding protein [Bradyrhizobium sp. 138]|uniref:ABC transporter substrate-binding protein n=1 Tax=Bradyrhizobium sp. 138 TaxID=2782615 RepID=UPI001FFAC665|nr:ABC transporter substrate-binding protein [Bradyrhizobium sp. 138]MCK1738305.1 ABC transporter substrate-binding protein [Bradyrhizobium sp. 138]
MTFDFRAPVIGSAEALRLASAFRRGATRRDVIRMLMAAGMSAAVAGTTASFAETAHAQTPRRGGKIRVVGGLTSAVETLDPAKGYMGTDWSRGRMFYSGLTVLDETLTPQLALAEEVASSERATVWNIKLRRDVRFHDGSLLTSADVVYSLRRPRNPALGSGFRIFAEQMEEITASGPHEVRIRLSGPNVDLPVILAAAGVVGFLIVKDGTTDFRTANGTGPYKCAEFQPGVRSIAVRNTEYFKAGKPYLDEIEMFGIADELARINALLSGEVHLITGVTPRSVQRITSAPNLALFETKGGSYNPLTLKLDTAPGSNPDFVLAVKYLLNREQIRRAVYRDYAVIANDQPVDPSNRFYDPGLPQRPFDLDKARFHLQRSGFANQTFPMVVSPAAPNSEEIAQLVQQTARQIGLNFDLQRVPGDGYWTSHWMKHPIFYGSAAAKPSADVIFTQNFQSQAPWNESVFRNERLDKLLLESRAEADDNKRREMYGEMQRLVHEGSGVCIPVFSSTLDAHVRNLKGLRPIAISPIMGYNFAENVWLDQ